MRCCLDARWLLAIAIGSACRFEPGQLGSQDAALDGPVVAHDAALVDAPIDATPDAAVPPSTTNHSATEDTFLASDFPDSNFDYQTSMLVDGGDTPRVVLIRFDLSSIPASAMVTGAELHIWTFNDPGNTVSLYPVLEAWSETESTWNLRAALTAWSAAGAAPPARDTTEVGSVLPANTFTEYTIALTASTVQTWVTTPAANFGLALVTTDANGTRFSTREYATTTSRPYLRVTHIP